MGKKFYKNEKFQAVFFPVLYFLLTISIVVTGCYIFYKKYYQPIVVEGSSMQPTLVGGGACHTSGYSYRYNFGMADLHNNAINSLKRFDVVVTYYPSSWIGPDNTYKIKRVWGFPGETLNLSYSSETQTFEFKVTHSKDGGTQIYKSDAITSVERTYEIERFVENKPQIKTETASFTVAKFSIPSKSFYVRAEKIRQINDYKLGKNEYFVMGDNWVSSTDSYEKMSNPDKLTRSYIQGRVLYISAYVSLVKGDPAYFHKFKERYYF